MIAVKHAFLAAKQKFLMKQKEKILKSNDTEALEMVDKELTAVTKQLDKLRDTEARLMRSSKYAIVGGALPKDKPLSKKKYDKRRELIEGVENLRHKNNPFALEYAIITSPLLVARMWGVFHEEKKKTKTKRSLLKPLFDAIDNAISIEIKNPMVKPIKEVAINTKNKSFSVLFQPDNKILIVNGSKSSWVDVGSKELKQEILEKMQQKREELKKVSRRKREERVLDSLKEYTK